MYNFTHFVDGVIVAERTVLRILTSSMKHKNPVSIETYGPLQIVQQNVKFLNS